MYVAAFFPIFSLPTLLRRAAVYYRQIACSMDKSRPFERRKFDTNIRGNFCMSEQKKKVAVVMGSDSDWDVVKGAVLKLKSFEIPVEVRVLSAHRTPGEAAEFSANAQKSGFGVIIAAAGKAAHLAGVLAAHTTLPVIGIPVKSSALDGLDALLATVQMPSGIPVATVAINGAENAAILAAQMLALSDPVLMDKLAEMKQQMEQSVLKKDQALQEKVQAL